MNKPTFYSLLFAFCYLFYLTPPALAQSNNLQENKKLAMQAVDIWLSGSKVDPNKVFSPDYINNLDSSTSDSAGPQKRNLKQLEEEAAKFHTAFKDVKAINNRQVAEGDLVATHITIRAKHVGSFMGENPTKKTITWDAVEFSKIQNGKIVEAWVTWDKYGFLKQLGALE
ncbi:ester cyclase [Microbulbifer sp. JMSA004]|uniref:ester cyclase n=1 Tax=unclassified Microbulbifer TaxID=2619833 RepID=UPI0024AE0DBD|nr:ester cyclase [Microbulbifer sp. VAAF005]WHI46479.1 ester cyclase [Microbulbifer sp. VAAF005]